MGKKSVGGGGGGRSYQEDLVGALAEGGVVRAVHRGLAGELGVKLAEIIGRLLPGEEE